MDEDQLEKFTKVITQTSSDENEKEDLCVEGDEVTVSYDAEYDAWDIFWFRKGVSVKMTSEEMEDFMKTVLKVFPK